MSEPNAGRETPWKNRLVYPMALLYVTIGILHFATPEPFIEIMPSWLPMHRELVLVSGAFEIALGLAVVPRSTRRWAAWGLVLLLCAVFPANVNMALHEIPMGHAPPRWVAWGRLPLQAVLVAWAFWYTRRAEPPSRAEHTSDGNAR